MAYLQNRCVVLAGSSRGAQCFVFESEGVETRRTPWEEDVESFLFH